MMNESDALLYAQKIWGAGQWNAKVKRVGRKHQVGRHMAKSSWILGEGASWEEAFRAYWIDTLSRRLEMYKVRPASARGSLTDAEFHQNNADIQTALNNNTLPVL